MRTLPELYSLFTARRAEHAMAASVMVALAGVYDGELVTRIAELDETAESSVPNIVNQGIDAYARSAAEARPDVDCPAVRPNIASSRQRAVERARVIKGWQANSLMSSLDYQRFRYYFGFGGMPVQLRSDPSNVGVPRWHALNPIGVLPGPKVDSYSPEVPDCFVVAHQSARWVHDVYGITYDRNVRPDTLLEVVTYADGEQETVFCTGLTGPTVPYHPLSGKSSVYDGGDLGLGTYGGYWSERGTHIERLGTSAGNNWLVTLSSVPNYAGTCTVSCPGAISLSKVTGLVNGILSKHKLHARLMALTVKAIAKGILPDEWVQTDPNSNGQGVVTEADGLRGVRGHIDGGQIVVPQINPSYMTMPLLDRIEANSRSEAGIPVALGGEAGVNIRSRAQNDSTLGAVLDPRIREAHTIAAAALEHESRIGIAIAKGYGGSRPRSFYVSGRRQKTQVEYVATDLFENDEVHVHYPLAGTDLNGMVIVAGQSVGTGMLSKETARRLNPLAEDDEAVKIRAEAAEEVLMANLQMLVESSPADGAYVTRKLREGDLPEDVWDAVQRRIQERQATEAPVGEPLGPAAPGSPEAQPGLGEPGVANAPPVIEEPPQSLRNLASLMTSVRRPQMTIPAERAG